MAANKPTTILAIESSCDETGVAVLQQNGQEITILADSLASQANLHKQTGGVVPENAARQHLLTMAPLVRQVLSEAGGETLDAIAVTIGPGLIPALSVGVTYARSLAYAWQKPLVPIHHLEGHLYSALLLETSPKSYNLQPTTFPLLALIVSGGHTMLVEMEDHLHYRIIGQTLDDAAGEVFDKVARMLGLAYPGGPEISRLAERGNPAAYAFPRPMITSGDLNFSFSGLKTAVLYELKKIDSEEISKNAEHIAASFQEAVVDSLINKVAQAIQQRTQNPYKQVLLTGGVAANRRLQQKMEATASHHQLPLRIAPLHLTGDNAVMIGQAALMAFQHGRTKDWHRLDASARLNLEDFSR